MRVVSTGVFAFFVITAPPAAAEDASASIRAAEVVRELPHDSRAFTQGLFFSQGRLFETTGQVGESVLREVDLATGKVIRETRLPGRYFGEGSTDWGDGIVSLTWHGGTAFRWRRDDFELRGFFKYNGEGWGLTQDGASLIMSDGSAELRFLDPASFAERRRITVSDGGVPIENLNELEFVGGEILANVWMQDRIARIDPATGHVIGWIDCSAIVRRVNPSHTDSVLNGIAYDAKARRLYVTGKRWPKLFEIQLPKR